jgi:hypothetical protein
MTMSGRRSTLSRAGSKQNNYRRVRSIEHDLNAELEQDLEKELDRALEMGRQNSQSRLSLETREKQKKLWVEPPLTGHGNGRRGRPHYPDSPDAPFPSDRAQSERSTQFEDRPLASHLRLLSRGRGATTPGSFGGTSRSGFQPTYD